MSMSMSIDEYEYEYEYEDGMGMDMEACTREQVSEYWPTIRKIRRHGVWQWSRSRGTRASRVGSRRYESSYGPNSGPKTKT